MSAGDWLLNDDISNLLQPKKREAALRGAGINMISELAELDLAGLRSIPGITDHGISQLKRAIENRS